MNKNLPKLENPPPPKQPIPYNGEQLEPWRPTIKTTDDGEPRGSNAAAFLCELLLIAVLIGSVVYAVSVLIK